MPLIEQQYMALWQLWMDFGYFTTRKNILNFTQKTILDIWQLIDPSSSITGARWALRLLSAQRARIFSHFFKNFLDKNQAACTMRVGN
jgi:hypothetical protein